MANPNIVNVTTIYGNTYGMAVSTVNTSFISNPAGSNSIYKINSVQAANINTAASSVNLYVSRGGTLANTYIAYNIVVSANSTQVLVGKDTAVYLLENDSLYTFSSANNYLQILGSWEQIS